MSHPIPIVELTDEREVDDLKQPRWDLLAKDLPAVVLAIADPNKA